jgi:ketol-acid reductoisomerase
LPSVVVMVVAAGFTVVEVSMVAAEAEVTMVIVADMLSSVTMAAAITPGADTTDTVVAMAGAAATAGVADTDGVGGILATVGDGVSA